MAVIGKINQLKIDREVEFGVYLDGEELGEILLPKKYLPENYKTGDLIEVFIYFDSEDRIIATTEKPYAQVGEFALLKVVSVTSVGAFLDWGLQKDLLAPFREQKQKMEEGKSYVVYVYLDNLTNRIAASSKLDKFLNKQPPGFTVGQEVELFIVNKTDLGYKAIINGSHWGILYENEVFTELKKGLKTKGFIKKLRSDGKIDLSLYKSGYEKVDEQSEKILSVLKSKGGFMEITDKTPPETIYDLFGVSKKTYKKAIGSLFKRRLVTIRENGIKLTDLPD